MRIDTSDRRLQIAVFRYSLIAPLLRLEPGSEAFGRQLRETAARPVDIPGSRRASVSVTTLRRWLRTYRDDGLEGLQPKRRSDRNSSRALDERTAAVLAGIKADTPALSVRLAIRRALRSGLLPPDTRLAESTVYRMLRAEGLAGRRAAAAPAKDRRRFAYRLAGEMWQSDAMHGPKIRCDPRRRGKTYRLTLLLCATAHKSRNAL